MVRLGINVFFKTLCLISTDTLFPIGLRIFPKTIVQLSKSQLNRNLTQLQPNITLVGLDTKMTLQTTPHHHPTQTQCQQYPSCY